MPDKLKTVFILPALTAGGAEMVLVRLMNKIDRDQFIPFFIAVQNKGRLQDYISKDIAFECLNATHVIKSLPKIYKSLKIIRPDIVVSTLAHMNFAILLLRPFFPKTFFIIRESTLPACTLHGRGSLKFLIRMLYKFLYPKADIILAPAQIILDQMQSELGLSSDKMQVLPNPIDDIQITPENPTNSRIIKFICVGRLHYEKGFDRLIDALGSWKTSQMWHLNILGEGPKKNQLRKLITLHNLEEKISLKGFQKNPAQMLANADYFLLPSRWEGSPNAALEALAQGTPVIALKDAGGIVEIAAEAPAGAVILCNDITEFVNAMGHIETPKYPKYSLLPAKYRQDSAIAQFEKILNQSR